MDLCVAYLVRQADGVEPVRRFFDSYAAHPAGVRHRVVLILKGFRDPAAREPYLAAADGLHRDIVEVADEGFDLTTYFAAAERIDGEALCFLNTFSVIRAPDWLAVLQRALELPDAGLVGATGSWESHHSAIRYYRGLKSPYRRVLDPPEDPGVRGIRQRVERRIAVAAATRGFEPFPAHHVRTNAFIARREVLLAVRPGELRDKADAYRLESGKRSVTRQIQAAGLRALVVGRDGVAYDQDDWDRADTFWQSDQQNLLVDDNQTARYRESDAAQRALMSRFAWGERARPAAGRAAAAQARG